MVHTFLMMYVVALSRSRITVGWRLFTALLRCDACMGAATATPGKYLWHWRRRSRAASFPRPRPRRPM